jgi:hypothetical protein
MKTIIKILSPLASLIYIIRAVSFTALKNWIKKRLSQAKITWKFHDIPNTNSLHLYLEINKPVKDITLSITLRSFKPTDYSIKITPFIQYIGREHLENIELHEEDTKNKKMVKFDLAKKGAFRIIISGSIGRVGRLFSDNFVEIEVNAPNTKIQYKENKFLHHSMKLNQPGL